MKKNGLPKLEDFTDWRGAHEKHIRIRGELSEAQGALADLERKLREEIQGRASEGEAIERAARRLLDGDGIADDDACTLRSLQDRIAEARRKVEIFTRAAALAKQALDDVRDACAAKVSQRYRAEHERRVARIGKALRELSEAIKDHDALLRELHDRGLRDEIVLPSCGFPGIGRIDAFDSPIQRWHEAVTTAGFDVANA